MRSVQQTEVTGFHLIVLCHKFGLRGRAFAASLSKQDCTYAINLSVCYERQKDKELLEQGLNLSRTVRYRFLPRVKNTEIMQRAKQFHALDPAWGDPSHVVYTDCDLWFPPTFFQEYGELLSVYPNEYWGCPVQNINKQGVDVLIPKWKNLKEEDLFPYVRGLRYPGSKGRAGHFQCVPVNQSEYPDDPICGVSKADSLFANANLHHVPPRADRRIGTRPAYHLDHPRAWSGVKEEC